MAGGFGGFGAAAPASSGAAAANNSTSGLGFGASSASSLLSTTTTGSTTTEKGDSKSAVVDATKVPFGSSSSSSTLAGTEKKLSSGPSYNDKKVGSIVRDWKLQLADDLKSFKRQSEQVAVWDNQLRANNATLNEISDVFENIFANSIELERMCDNIEEYQNDLDVSLQQLEDAVRREKEIPHAPFNQEDYNRYYVYQESELLVAELVGMEQKLVKLVESFNKARGGGEAKTDGNAVGKIVSVLNQHFDQLAGLQRKTQELESNIDRLKRGS